MNFAEGKVVKKDRFYFEGSGFNFSVPENIEEKVSTFIDKDIVLGVRPESIYDHDFEDRAQLTEKNEIHIDVTEPIGAETLIYFRNGGKEHCMRSSSGLTYENGQKINIGFDVARLYFFDQQTGKRLA